MHVRGKSVPGAGADHRLPYLGAVPFVGLRDLAGVQVVDGDDAEVGTRDHMAQIRRERGRSADQALERPGAPLPREGAAAAGCAGPAPQRQQPRMLPVAGQVADGLEPVEGLRRTPGVEERRRPFQCGVRGTGVLDELGGDAGACVAPRRRRAGPPGPDDTHRLALGDAEQGDPPVRARCRLACRHVLNRGQVPVVLQQPLLHAVLGGGQRDSAVIADRDRVVAPRGRAAQVPRRVGRQVDQPKGTMPGARQGVAAARAEGEAPVQLVLAAQQLAAACVPKTQHPLVPGEGRHPLPTGDDRQRAVGGKGAAVLDRLTEHTLGVTEQPHVSVRPGHRHRPAVPTHRDRFHGVRRQVPAPSAVAVGGVPQQDPAALVAGDHDPAVRAHRHRHHGRLVTGQHAHGPDRVEVPHTQVTHLVRDHRQTPVGTDGEHRPPHQGAALQYGGRAHRGKPAGLGAGRHDIGGVRQFGEQPYGSVPVAALDVDQRQQVRADLPAARTGDDRLQVDDQLPVGHRARPPPLQTAVVRGVRVARLGLQRAVPQFM